MTSPFELPTDVIREAVPDDEIVTAYVMRGAMARYVEGVAAVNADFREELLASIDGLEAAGEEISAAARAWREPSATVVPIHREGGKQTRSSLRWVPYGFAAAGLLFAVGAYQHHRASEAEMQALETRKQREAAEANAQLEKLMADLKSQQEATMLAQNELATARSDAERSNAQAKVAAAQQQARTTQTQITAVRAGTAAGSKASTSAKAACKCQAGDPLCACF